MLNNLERDEYLYIGLGVFFREKNEKLARLNLIFRGLIFDLF